MKKLLILLVLCFLSGCDNYISTEFNSDYDYEAEGYIPALPGSFRATKIGIDHIVLEWNDCSMDEAGFTIRKRFEPAWDFFGVYFDTFQVAPNSTQYIDSFNVSQTDVITYHVSAFNSAGQSRGEQICYINVYFPQLAAINYEYLDDRFIKLTWEQDEIYENTGYEIEYSRLYGDFVLVETLSADTREYILDTNISDRPVYSVAITTLYRSRKSFKTVVFPHRN